MTDNLGCLLNGHNPFDTSIDGKEANGFTAKCKQCGSKIWTPPSQIDPEWNWMLLSDKPNGY
jgi:hypothetical protein